MKDVSCRNRWFRGILVFGLIFNSRVFGEPWTLSEPEDGAVYQNTADIAVAGQTDLGNVSFTIKVVKVSDDTVLQSKNSTSSPEGTISDTVDCPEGGWVAMNSYGVSAKVKLVKDNATKKERDVILNPSPEA